ncbi:hypothetical protein FJ958_15440 [Mesorhizobium sp. B2-3-5]|nr:hypothetical protein FJ958_15440 [Mesorhizobium sp. B2-3-5]
MNRTVCAAPHRPAGHFSPYGDGEESAFANGFANHQRCRKGAVVAALSLLPVTIREEGAGRRMRGCVIVCKVSLPLQSQPTPT